MLLEFLKAYLVWAEAGAPKDNEYGFTDYCGLCYNSEEYERQVLGTYVGYLSSIECKMDELHSRDGRSISYPFGKDAYCVYYDGRLSEQPERIAWVRATIKELSNA